MKLKMIVSILLMIIFNFMSINTFGQQAITDKNQFEADSLGKLGQNKLANLAYKKNIKLFIYQKEYVEAYKCIREISKNSLVIQDPSFFIDSFDIIYGSFPDTVSSVKIKLKFLQAKVLSELGLINNSIYSNLEVLEIINNKLQTSTKDNLYRYYTLYNLGTNYARLGEYNSALKYLNSAYFFASEASDHNFLCEIISVKGSFQFYMAQYENAKMSHMLANKECNYDIDIEISKCLIEQDSLDKAKYILDTLGVKLNHLNKIDIYSLSTLADYYAAKEDFTKVIKIRTNMILDINKHQDFRSFLREFVILGQVYAKASLPEDANITAQKALKLYYKGNIDSNGYLKNIDSLRIIPDIWIVEAFLLKANYHKRKYLDNGASSDLEKASYFFNLLFTGFDQIKSEYNAAESQLRIGQYTSDIYGDLIDFYGTLYRKKGEQIYFEKALELMQNSNAYVLKNAVSERQSFELNEIPRDITNKYFSLKQEANQKDNSGESDTEDLDAYLKYKDEMFLQFPEIEKYVTQKHLTLDEIKNNLNPNEILLKFYYHKDYIQRVFISKENQYIDKLKFDAELKEKINLYYNIVSNPNNWNEFKFKEVSHSIYLALFTNIEEKITDQINHLIILPDGLLKKLSFNSLLKEATISDIQSKSYLIHDYEISYLYYINQLAIKSNDNKGKDKTNFIGFGIEYQDEYLQEIADQFKNDFGNTRGLKSLSLSPLNFADNEVQNSASIFNGKSILNEEVTIENVLEHIGNNKMVHFSAHSLLDEDNYLDSYILLNRSQKDDNKLSYKDILNLNLDSELIVLSACQTSAGANIQGEGLMSLSRAFIQSGSKASMGAYWNAPDKATMQLMQLFYKYINEGDSKSAALRHAQLEYLTNDDISGPTTRSPFYWSSWALYGNSAPIIITSKFDLFNYTVGIVLIIIFLIIIFIIIKQKKVKQKADRQPI